MLLTPQNIFFTSSTGKPLQGSQLVPVTPSSHQLVVAASHAAGGAEALVRAAPVGADHGQRVAAPRSAALGTAADAAAAQILVASHDGVA